MSTLCRVLRKASTPILKVRWRLNNRHNGTTMARRFDAAKVKVGRFSYGSLDVSFFGSENERLVIGDFCSIASGVRFVCGGDHRTDTVSTFPFEKRCFNKTEALCKGPIVVKDDVWIGTNALILSGVTIGQGSVIAAGAVVVSDVPPYSIVGGVPAKVIKMRFDEITIQQLMAIDFSSIDSDFIRRNIELLTRPIDGDSINLYPRVNIQ